MNEVIGGLTVEQHNEMELGKAVIHKKSTNACCVAHGCNQKVPRHHLMCVKHWFRVPIGLRNKINTLYRDGNTYLSLEYFAAVGQAVKGLM
jgi:hypothetical protein